MAKGKYDTTLNLPRTEFPMRANLPKREPEILDFWDEIDIYKKVGQKNQGRPKFILHDGPPYANGNIHLGTSMNKVLKDMIIKFKSLSGYDSPYTPGWDTHGLPIEQQAIKDLGLDRHKTDVVEFRHHCRDYAMKYVEIQKQQFKRLGVRGDWDNPYLTLKPAFEGVQIKVFGEMARRGYIYKGLKPVYWCADCETALAEAEVEYQQRRSHSIYVKFPVKDGKGVLPSDAFVIIWTTTPWTLPANMGIALHPEFEYVLVGVETEKYLLAKGLLETAALALSWSDYKILQEVKGAELERVVCSHPFFKRDSLVILGRHVTLEAGTGCVHTSPGHGEDDFYVGKEYGLEILCPVDDKGCFTEQGQQFAGMFVTDANTKIIEELQNKGMLLKAGEVEHQYPYCWRCKKPILFRATEQWFASIDSFRQEILDAIDQVEWIPVWGRERIYNMVRDRVDWCISRQRTWGVPIPIFYCAACGETIIDESTINQVSGMITQFGSGIWFEKPAAELLPPGYKCPNCSQGEFVKETDIMDVWFDSGSSHMAVLDHEDFPDLHWPADMYLEGSDQHRGWFNSSISTSVAIRNTAPYRKVLTHGFIVDEQGRKMSKSLGNAIDPLVMIEDLGADILRLWVCSSDYRNDVSVSENIIRQSAEAYRKIRNTCRFVLSNLFDYELDKHKLDYEKLGLLDRWALLKLHRLISRVTRAFAQYEFHLVFHAIHNFCTIEMSNIYFDVLKDKLYCSNPNDPERKAAQAVMCEIIRALTVMLVPVLAYTSEEIWRFLRTDEEPVSVQLLEWPQVKEEYLSGDLEEKVDRLLLVREVVTKALEEARGKKVIGHSLAAAVTIYAAVEWQETLAAELELKNLFIVSSVSIKPVSEMDGNAVSLEHVAGIGVKVEGAIGEKCERCWIISPQVGRDDTHPTLCERCAEVVEFL